MLAKEIRTELSHLWESLCLTQLHKYCGHILVDANEADLVKRIKELEAREDEVVKAVEEMKKAEV